MIPGDGETFPDQLAANFLHHFPGQAIDDTAFPLMAFQVIYHGGIFILGRLYAEVEIRPVKTSGHDLGISEHKYVDDIIPHFRCGGGCKCTYNGPLRKLVNKIHYFQITGPEILAPL